MDISHLKDACQAPSPPPSVLSESIDNNQINMEDEPNIHNFAYNVVPSWFIRQDNPFADKNTYRRKLLREYNVNYREKFMRDLQFTSELIKRIGLEVELSGHHGCVNCLEWNELGNILASGSDDCQAILWDPFANKMLTKVQTQHHGNIFAVKFLPGSNDSILVTGAADKQVLVHDVEHQSQLHCFTNHSNRVKRIAVTPDEPSLFWSAAEDGTVMQFDLRCPEKSEHNVLIDLTLLTGRPAELKCIAINRVRSEQLVIGADDPYVRLYDRRMLSLRCGPFNSLSSPTNDRLPSGCVQYFIPGHIPKKLNQYRHNYRSLASTYVTFSPSGTELLVNLGGEQIYLFDINNADRTSQFLLPHQNGVSAAEIGMNTCYNFRQNGALRWLQKRGRSASGSIPLSSFVEELKNEARRCFRAKNYNRAIVLYNEALSRRPDCAILFNNRSAAFKERSWDGDLYAALRDCLICLSLDPEHNKAHIRLSQCLYELGWVDEAKKNLKQYCQKFPNLINCEKYKQMEVNINSHVKPAAAADDTELSEQEIELQKGAGDFCLRFCGHCNTTTDIKEANFLGRNGQFVVAGSDDGSFFVWERDTTNLVRVMRGDSSIVNCLQPHPTYCMLATSGIDDVVRIWTPRDESGYLEDREVNNSDDAALANQRRMNADPLEAMLLNMGYRLRHGQGEEGEDVDRAVSCNPS